jgi:hypothetical protein
MAALFLAVAGALAGNVIDQALFGGRRNVTLEGPWLSDLTVMASTEGAPIACVYALLNVRFGSLADKPSIAQNPLLSALVQKRTFGAAKSTRRPITRGKPDGGRARLRPEPIEDTRGLFARGRSEMESRGLSVFCCTCRLAGPRWDRCSRGTDAREACQNARAIRFRSAAARRHFAAELRASASRHR